MENENLNPLSKLSSLKSEQILEQTLGSKEVLREIEKLLKETQLSKGENTDGAILGVYAKITQDYYSKITPLPKKPKMAGQPYNLEWTGGLFDSIDAKYFKKGMVGIDGADHPFFDERNENEILNLNDENVKKIISDVWSKITKKYLSKLT
jgi:hypothetical protein